MSRKAVLIAVIFLVSTLGLVVTPAAAQPLMRVYGWGAVRVYDDYRGEVDASGGVFFSVRGDRWMVWAYFRDPYTNELIYLTLVALGAHAIIPDYGIGCVALWDVYVDWVYAGVAQCDFEVWDWRSWGMAIDFGPCFFVEGSVMFSRVRPYYMIT